MNMCVGAHIFISMSAHMQLHMHMHTCAFEIIEAIDIVSHFFPTRAEDEAACPEQTKTPAPGFISTISSS